MASYSLEAWMPFCQSCCRVFKRFRKAILFCFGSKALVSIALIEACLYWHICPDMPGCLAQRARG